MCNTMRYIFRLIIEKKKNKMPSLVFFFVSQGIGGSRRALAAVRVGALQFHDIVSLTTQTREKKKTNLMKKKKMKNLLKQSASPS